MKRVIKQDFSPRQEIPVVAVTSKITPAVALPPVVLPRVEPIRPVFIPGPVGVSAPAPVSAPVSFRAPRAPSPIPLPFSFRQEIAPTQLPYSAFSPNLETFPSSGESYFVTQRQVIDDIGSWATYPAVADVNADGFNFLGSVIGPTGTFQDVSGVNGSFQSVNIFGGTGTFQSLNGGTGTFQNLSVGSGTIVLSDTAGNQVLQAIGTDLFYDGQLLAKAGDIQNISDWSLYPAIANVDVQGYNIEGTNGLMNFATVSGDLRVLIQNTPANTSILLDGGSNITLDSLGGGNIVLNPSDYVAVGLESGAVSALHVDKIQNLSQPFGTAGQVLGSDGTKIVWETLPSTNPSQWATYPAVANVELNGNNVTDTNVGIVADQTSNLAYSNVNLTGQGGIGGRINLTGNPGVAGVNGGSINLTANGGTSPAGLYGQVSIVAQPGTALVGETPVTTGGRIDITANSGSALTTATSAINLSAGGVNIYSGIASPIASLFGYGFTNASLGLSHVVGLPASGFQIPGTLYQYAPAGIVLNSDVYTTAVYPYWNGLAPPANLSINGRTTVSGSASVILNNVATMSMEGSGAITGVNTINGSAYPPPTPAPGVTSLNGLAGGLSLTSSSITITPGGSTINLEAVGGSAAGPAGSIQYSDGSGGFSGNNGLLYNGVSRITNSTGLNFIDINETANANSVAIESNSQVNITAGPLLSLNAGQQLSLVAGTNLIVDIGGSRGTAGQVLTSNGTDTVWGVGSLFVASFDIYVAPNGNDATGNGSSQNPYLTIGQAIIKRATISSASKVCIQLASGTYTQNFILAQNTFLVGVPSGEFIEPTSIIGNILMTTAINTSAGLTNLSITGNSGIAVASNTSGNFALTNCNITAFAGFNAINQSVGGTFVVSNCRITGSTVTTIQTSSAFEIYNSIVLSASASIMVNTQGPVNAKRTTFTSTSSSTAANPIIRFGGSASQTIEVGWCKINYTSAVVDIGGLKACMAFANNTGTTYTAQFYNSVLICEGAITGSPQIQCIQNTGTSLTNTIQYGNLLSGATANHIAPTITHVALTNVT